MAKTLNGIDSQRKDTIHNNQEIISIKNYSIIGIIFWQSKVLENVFFSV